MVDINYMSTRTAMNRKKIDQKKKVIPVFLDKCLYSPFEFPLYRKKMENKGIKLVRHARAAKVIMSSYQSGIKKYLKLKNKKFLIWTHEPYQDYAQKSKIVIDGVTVHVMNCYTSDVFTHNHRYFYFKTPLDLLEIEEGDQDKPALLKDKEGPKMVVLSTYYDRKYYQNNPQTKLPIRYSLIEHGYSRGYLDVYGKGWDKYPTIREQGNSRNDKDRRISKGEILEKYDFNICLDNAHGPYYITEKIWEAIRYGCLPIYYSNSTIYESFPKESFVDYRDYGSSEKLYEFLESMSLKQYKTRMNRCISAFNSIIEEGKTNLWRGKSSNLNINYLEYETCYKKLYQKILKI